MPNRLGELLAATRGAIGEWELDRTTRLGPGTAAGPVVSPRACASK